RLSRQLSSISRPERPPASTLFPYTTLFRSSCDESWNGSPSGWREAREIPHAREDRAEGFRCGGRHLPVRGRVGQDVLPGRGGSEDRKSTRLNSSHVSISYAVFCLKKKRKKN